MRNIHGGAEAEEEEMGHFKSKDWCGSWPSAFTARGLRVEDVQERFGRDILISDSLAHIRKSPDYGRGHAFYRAMALTEVAACFARESNKARRYAQGDYVDLPPITDREYFAQVRADEGTRKPDAVRRLLAFPPAAIPAAHYECPPDRPERPERTSARKSIPGGGIFRNPPLPPSDDDDDGPDQPSTSAKARAKASKAKRTLGPTEAALFTPDAKVTRPASPEPNPTAESNRKRIGEIRRRKAAERAEEAAAESRVEPLELPDDEGGAASPAYKTKEPPSQKNLLLKRCTPSEVQCARVEEVFTKVGKLLEKKEEDEVALFEPAWKAKHPRVESEGEEAEEAPRPPVPRPPPSSSDEDGDEDE